LGRKSRDKRPQVRPVEKLELSGEKPALRAVAAALFLLIGAAALAYAFSQLFTQEPGWQTIQAGTADGPTCGEDFTFLYELGASGRPAREEGRALTGLYTRTCRRAFQLFHTDEGFEGVVNLYDINHRPNEVLEVDPALYRAFEAVQRAGDRTLYLGPIVTRYDDLFYCEDDSQLADFDPRLSREVAEEYAAIAAFANDPEQIDVELLGDHQICLRVSEGYLAYARQEGIDRFLDFGWMKNAFIADYLAEAMAGNGYTFGTISSVDGFARCLDSREGSYGLNLLAWLKDRPIQAGTLEYRGPMNMASLRAFPAAEGDESRYYRLSSGEIRTLYLDPQDGLCRLAADSAVCYSPEHGCAELAMGMAPAFVADMICGDALKELAGEGIEHIYCRDGAIYASDPDVAVTGLYENGEGVRYSVAASPWGSK